jgi:hypothetical protein
MVVRDPWRVRFEDGRWRSVTVRMWRRGRTGRDIAQMEFSLNRQMYGDSFYADPQKMKTYEDAPPE